MIDELHNTTTSKAAGIVLDVSLRHINGQSKISIIKESLSELFIKYWSPDDLVYITVDADRDRLPKHRGEGLSWLASFTPSEQMDAAFLFRHTTDMIATCTQEDKYLFYISDRCKPVYEYHISDTMGLSNLREDGVGFVLIDVGCKNPDILSSAVENYENAVALTAKPFDTFRTVVDQFLLQETNGRNECER